MLAPIYPIFPKLSWSATTISNQENRLLIFKVPLLAMDGRILCTRYHFMSLCLVFPRVQKDIKI